MNTLEHKLGDLYLENSRNGIYKSPEHQGRGVKLIKMNQQFGHRFIHDRLPDIELLDLTDDELSRFKLEENDLLFSRTSVVPEGVGMCSIVRAISEPLAFESNIIRVRLDPNKSNPEFVFRYFQSHSGRGKVLAIAGGTNIKTIKGSSLKEISLPLPLRAIQDSTVDSLRAYDDLIENNCRRVQLLEDSAHMLFREWFVNLRFPGHEHVSTVNGVPAGWERTFVPDIISINPTTKAEKEKEITYIPMSSLSATGMTADKAHFEKRTTHTAVKFQQNDTLLARITPCLENGKTGFAYFLEANEVACGSTEFIILRGKRVSPYFTYCLARSYSFRENAIKSMIGSSGRQRVQTSCLNEFLVPLAPKSLLDQFDSAVELCFKQIQVLSDQIEKLAQARDLLLPRLMNGEITV